MDDESRRRIERIDELQRRLVEVEAERDEAQMERSDAERQLQGAIETARQWQQDNEDLRRILDRVRGERDRAIAAATALGAEVDSSGRIS